MRTRPLLRSWTGNRFISSYVVYKGNRDEMSGYGKSPNPFHFGDYYSIQISLIRLLYYVLMLHMDSEMLTRYQFTIRIDTVFVAGNRKYKWYVNLKFWIVSHSILEDVKKSEFEEINKRSIFQEVWWIELNCTCVTLLHNIMENTVIKNDIHTLLECRFPFSQNKF